MGNKGDLCTAGRNPGGKNYSRLIRPGMRQQKTAQNRVRWKKKGTKLRMFQTVLEKNMS